ncbi:hypothetical protein [Bacillus cereus group sp. BfR-BA-02730]|uniref:hypothetical protein n=1 Tax=Bacillus cereus group sp. BfR-BA-02730 TaxID=3094893 RepID=UPI0029C17A12|nr:hypothetical protein [Bacillus cereus group sp. BfR-BA-02730]MDX5808367.1 hypothetical protein [Bacillus cereus group sp. BfR-BA-02730]
MMKKQFTMDENMDRLLDLLHKNKDEHGLDYQGIGEVVAVSNPLTGRSILVDVWGHDELSELKDQTRRIAIYEVFKDSKENQYGVVVEPEKLLYKASQPKRMMDWVVSELKDNQNRELIEKKIEKMDEYFELGCYDSLIENLSIEELNKVLERLEEECTDVAVVMDNKTYVVEIKTVDDEKDLHVLSADEYKRRYGVSEEDFNDKFDM